MNVQCDDVSYSTPCRLMLTFWTHLKVDLLALPSEAVEASSALSEAETGPTRHISLR